MDRESNVNEGWKDIERILKFDIKNYLKHQ